MIKQGLYIAITMLLVSCGTQLLTQKPKEEVIIFDDGVVAEKLPDNPGPLFYWQYPDADGDGFGNGQRADSLFKKKLQVGYSALKGDCDDANALIHPGAKDACGLDLNCNGIESEGAIFKNFWHDGDQDGFGDAADVVSSCNVTVPEYVSNNADCNDLVATIYPAAPEQLNGIDDNCNGSVDEGLVTPGITITTSNVLMPEYMNAGGTNEMFVNNSPDDAAWLAKLTPGNFGSWVHTEGHNSQWFRWKEPFGAKGNGFNPVKPADVTQEQFCGVMNGDLCKSYTRDFNLSWIDLCENTGGKPIYTCNISRGTLAELYYAIERLPDLKIIMYGQELATGSIPALTSKTYAPKFYEWVDSVKARFPGRELYHLADIPDIGGKKVAWTQDFINYKKLPAWICVRQYSHGFTKYTLTGKINEDSSQYTYAINTSLPKQIANIDSTFMGGGVFLSQFSTGVPAYAVGTNNNKVALQGRCVDVMYYARAEKVFVEAHRDGRWHLLGANIIGLKNLMTSLDFKWLGVLNTLYAGGGYCTTVSHNLGSQVDVLAAYANGQYAVVVQNRSGKPITLPEYWQLDGRITKPVYSSQTGYSCTSLTATTGTDYKLGADGVIAGFGIVGFAVK